MHRRDFLKAMATVAAASVAQRALGQSLPQINSERLNVLLLTADDMNYDSLGCTGCAVPDISPNLDRLAREGMLFVHGHVTCGVCQPSRSALMTGRYPHRNGAMGFEPIRDDVPTLGESLRSAGYMNGIFAKVSHLAPRQRFAWDTVVEADRLAVGRDPALYHQHANEFFENAKSARKPFFLMCNSQDPHRPFAGSAQEKIMAQRRNRPVDAYPPAPRYYRPEEIVVPGFLPDLPDVRTEMAQYYSSVHRCDVAMGEVLRALRETGFEDNTLVMFISDNGISQPFAKSNCYLSSTRTPWIVRWPGKIKSGGVDDVTMISGIDFMPTVLEATGVEQVAGMDGRSFVDAMTQGPQTSRDRVFTVYHETSGKRKYPMRCVHDRRFGYIYNGWADGETRYQAEPMGGMAFAAMREAAEKDPAIAQRVNLKMFRTPEELYDFDDDPSCLKNLVESSEHRERLRQMRLELARWMEQTTDPLIETYRQHLAAVGESV